MPPPDPKVLAFRALVSTLGKAPNPQPLRFVKKLESIPQVLLLASSPRHMDLALSKCSMIKKFTGIWPSSRSMENWV
jgi:hypothetical protein